MSCHTLLTPHFSPFTCISKPLLSGFFSSTISVRQFPTRTPVLNHQIKWHHLPPYLDLPMAYIWTSPSFWKFFNSLVPKDMAAHSVFFSGKCHRQRSLANYSPQDGKVRHDSATKLPSSIQDHTGISSFCLTAHVGVTRLHPCHSFSHSTWSSRTPLMVSTTTYLLKWFPSLCSTLTTSPELYIHLPTKTSLSECPVKSPTHKNHSWSHPPNCPFFLDFLSSPVNVKINHPIAEARNQKIVFDSSFFLATGHQWVQQALFQPLSSLSWREVPQLSSCLQALTLHRPPEESV